MKIVDMIITAIIVVVFVICYFYFCVDINDVDFKKPQINKIQKIDVMEYSDTTHYCGPDCRDYFSARLHDSVIVVDFNLRCAICGKSWGRHQTRFEWIIQTQPYND